MCAISLGFRTSFTELSIERIRWIVDSREESGRNTVGIGHCDTGYNDFVTILHVGV